MDLDSIFSEISQTKHIVRLHSKVVTRKKINKNKLLDYKTVAIRSGWESGIDKSGQRESLYIYYHCKW